MLEQRIICKILPQSVESIEIINDKTLENIDNRDKNTENKSLKEAKRIKLDELIRDLEWKIFTIERKYREALKTFQPTSHTAYLKSEPSSLACVVKKFVTHRLKQFKQENRFNMTTFREKLYRLRRKHHLKSKRKQTVSVYPQTIIDVSTIPLNDNELSYLSSAGNIISRIFIHLD